MGPLSAAAGPLSRTKQNRVTPPRAGNGKFNGCLHAKTAFELKRTGTGNVTCRDRLLSRIGNPVRGLSGGGVQVPELQRGELLLAGLWSRAPAHELTAQHDM